MIVNIHDERRGGEAIQTRERRGANGDRILDVFLRDKLNRAIVAGDTDTAMAARFGLRPALGSR
jgi:hypothetical protein